MNGAVPGAHDNWRSTAVHLAVDPRRAERSLDGNGNVQADVPIMCAGIDICLQLAGYFQVNAAVAGVNVPRTLNRRSAVGSRGHTAIAGLNIQRIEAPLNVDVPVPGRGLYPAIQTSPFNRAVACSQVNVAFAPCTVILPSPLRISRLPVIEAASTDPSPLVTSKSASLGM